MLRTAPTADDVALLRAELDGHVVLREEERYDAARRAWNLAAGQRPALVAIPRSARDVQAIVRFARARGLKVAMQGTGHNGVPLGDAEDAVLVKTHEMRGVEIDAEHGIARVEAGALWIDVTQPASEAGYAALAGSSPDVGVVGYTLGGGLSLGLGRRYGLAGERVIAFEVVTADGRLVRTDRRNEPELFWALRGGGGAFAAVVAMEFELIPMREVFAGMLLWPGDRAAEVFHAWREWTEAVPDTITTSARFIRFPPLPELPPFLSGREVVIIDGANVGDQAAGDALLAPLRALEPEMDTFAMLAPVGLSFIHMDPEEPMPALSDAGLLDELTAEAVDAFLAVNGPGTDSPVILNEIRHLGGALRRGTGPSRGLQAGYATFFAGMPVVPELVPVIEAQLALTEAAMAPHHSGRRYLNFAERATDPAAFYGEDVLERLRQIKAEVDPSDVFRSNHPIAPAV